MRDYHSKNGNLGAVPIARCIDEVGLGAVELALRWSSIDLGDGLIDGSDMDIPSLAATWRLSRVFNINTNYRYITDDRLDLNDVASGANLRLLAVGVTAETPKIRAYAPAIVISSTRIEPQRMPLLTSWSSPIAAMR